MNRLVCYEFGILYFYYINGSKNTYFDEAIEMSVLTNMNIDHPFTGITINAILLLINLL